MRVRAICECGCAAPAKEKKALDGALGGGRRASDCGPSARTAFNHGLRLDPTLASLARLAE